MFNSGVDSESSSHRDLEKVRNGLCELELRALSLLACAGGFLLTGELVTSLEADIFLFLDCHPRSLSLSRSHSH